MEREGLLRVSFKIAPRVKEHNSQALHDTPRRRLRKAMVIDITVCLNGLALGKYYISFPLVLYYV